MGVAGFFQHRGCFLSAQVDRAFDSGLILYATLRSWWCVFVLGQVETGSAITWKYPSVVLKGDNSIGEFYSVALTNNRQQADTGTKVCL